MQEQPWQSKDRQYAQLSRNLSQLSKQLQETAELVDLLQADVRALAIVSGNHAAQYVQRSAL
jgi:hypothetical protein